MDNNLINMTLEFSVDILKFAENIKGHYSIVNQLERSATSIGANVREGRYAHSTADFVSKFQIALKESFETEYWLEIIQKAGLSDDESIKKLVHTCGSIRRILIASINTAKNKQKNN